LRAQPLPGWNTEGVPATSTGSVPRRNWPSQRPSGRPARAWKHWRRPKPATRWPLAGLT